MSALSMSGASSGSCSGDYIPMRGLTATSRAEGPALGLSNVALSIGQIGIDRRGGGISKVEDATLLLLLVATLLVFPDMF